MKMINKRFVSLFIVLCSLFCIVALPVHAVDVDVVTESYGGYNMTASITYAGPENGASLNLVGSWGGSYVDAFYAEIETVLYYTGRTLPDGCMQDTAYDTKQVSTGGSFVCYDTVTVYGITEIRDTFSLTAYPTLYGTTGN